MSFRGGEYERTLLFSFGMAAVFHSVFFFSSANIQHGNGAQMLCYSQSAPCVPSVAAPLGYRLPPPAVLFGCLLPDCAQLAAAEVSPLGRTGGGRVGPRPTAALLGPTHS